MGALQQLFDRALVALGGHGCGLGAGQPVIGLRPNRFLAVVCLIVLLAQMAIPFVPPLAEAFRASPLSPAEWLVAGLVAIAPAVVAEIIRARSGRLDWVA